MTTPPRGGGAFIKAVDLKPGDTAVIKTEADWIDSQFNKEDGTKQQQYVCVVDYEGEERRLKLTQASCEQLIQFGSDSADWVGRKVTLVSVPVMVGGRMKKSIYVEPYGAGIDQPGAVQPQTATAPAADPQPPKYDADGNEIAWDE